MAAKGKYVLLGWLALALATIAGFQNCSGFQAASVGSAATGPTADTDRVVDAVPLQCANAGSFGGGSAISLSEQIAAIGRLSYDQTDVGFLLPDGHAYKADVSQTSPVAIDAGHTYAWMSFADLPCGVTTDGKVRCRNSSSDPHFSEVPALNGSLQAMKVDTSTCGLQSDGTLTCVDAGSNVSTVTGPEPFILLNNGNVFGQSKTAYNLLSYLFDGKWVSSKSEVLLSTTAPDIRGSHVHLCDLKVIAQAFPEFENYTMPSGCGLSENGRIFCIATRYQSDNQRMNLVSVDENGDFSSELAPLDSTNQYSALVTYPYVNLGCAIRRGDNATVCFTRGFGAPFLSFQSQFHLTPTLKGPFHVASPATIDSGLASSLKGCYLRAGQATCFVLPSYEMLTGVSHAPYSVSSAESLRSIAGFIKNVDPVSKIAFQRACFLTVSGALVCEQEGLANRESGRLIAVDSGVSYKTVEFTSFDLPCGLTTANVLRCGTSYSDTTPSFSDRISNVSVVNSGYVLTAAGGYDGLSVWTPVGSTASPSHTSSVIYQSDVSGHPGLFRDTTNAIYALSYMPIAVSNADFTAVQNLKPLGGLSYFDPASSKCPHLTGSLVQNCYLAAGDVESDIASQSFNYLSTYMYVRGDGSIAAFYGGSFTADFIAPAPVAP